jgi:hypothetical protein
MTAISQELLAGAVVRFECLPYKDRLRLGDDVHQQQPNLLASVLVLHRYGVTFQRMEVVLDLLFVFHEAMKGSGKHWPVISLDMQDRCLQRVTARARFIEGLTAQQQNQVIDQGVALHPEKPMLAYVYGKFKEDGLIGIKTEAAKMMMLAALNMVECIAEAAPTTSTRPGIL